MDPDSEPPPTVPPAGVPAARGRAAASTGRWTLPKLPLLIAVVGIGGAVTAGSWLSKRTDARVEAEIQAIQAEVASLQAETIQCGRRLAALRQEAEDMRAAALRTSDEHAQRWARERARYFEAFVRQIAAMADDEAFLRAKAAIDAACADRKAAVARELLLKTPEVRFPSAARFRELQRTLYHLPLAQFSRQNPAYYAEFRKHEREAAGEDIAQLRQELAATALETVTPQSMLQLELYGAVAPPGDPLAEDWATLSSAADYFDDPDPATLATWRKAQRAVRREDWQTATAHMQSILRSTVRTRLPFRAAYARTLLKNRPDDPAAAYPFMQEAAAAGDAGARDWIVQEELRQGRPAQAVRWLESAVAAGDAKALGRLLDLYAEPPASVPRDRSREAGVLQKITVSPDAPPLASMLLAQLYQAGAGVPASSGNAFGYYRRAAEKNHVPAFASVARCHLRGQGTPVDVEQGVQWAARAFGAGDIDGALPLLLEAMQRDPDRAAQGVQQLFENQLIAGPSPFWNEKIHGPSMAQLQTALARYFDAKGMYAKAARFYARSGNRDPEVLARHSALTATRPCESCRGVGKIFSWAPCPTCNGKGTVNCRLCDGRGYTYVPGTPPCTACGGTGSVVQQGRKLACGTCGGNGKGKGSVVRRACTSCAQGQEPCRECGGAGRIRSTKECPDCHGTGARALADE